MNVFPVGVKPPQFYERTDVFAAIAALFHQHDIDAEYVRERFRGTLMMLNGTDIPDGHEDLAVSIKRNSVLMGMPQDQFVIDSLDWIESEKVRHTPRTIAPPSEAKEAGGGFSGPPYGSGRDGLDSHRPRSEG